MNVSAPFIRRPVATSLLTAALLLSGALAYPALPVSTLPEVAYPTIAVFANLPGASPETMASAVATPLERMFGRIAGITQMTSVSQLGSTNITMQFDLDRNVDAAGREVQAAINAARGQLPSDLPTNPGWRKVNPAGIGHHECGADLRYSDHAATLRRGGIHRRAEDFPGPWRRASDRGREFPSRASAWRSIRFC